MDAETGLSRLEAQIAIDLARISWPSASWVKPHDGPDGQRMLNVLIIGGGQGGLTTAFQLARERVDNILVVDRVPPAGRGPWKTYGRMKTLRSPKFTTGPDLDLPCLTFQSWFEAQYGSAAWEALGKIPKEMWADYLAWFERVLRLPVQSDVEVTAVRPLSDHVEVDARVDGKPRSYCARYVVLATGIEATGRWWMPDFLSALSPQVVRHTGDDIDFQALKGKVVAVLGAGASAFDNAATALEAGAAEVHVFWRRDEIQRVQPYKHISYTGILRHLGDLDDAMKWRFLRHLLTLREAFPVETWERVTHHDNAHLHSGRGWTGAALTREGRLSLETTKGPFVCDFAIAGTGFDMDLTARPELRDLAGRVALWSDRFQPPVGEDEPRLARYPYLGHAFEMQATMPEDTQAIERLRLFTFGATMSFGPSGSSINALKFAVPRLVQGLTRDLFREDAEAHLADLLAYDTPEF